LHSRLFNMEHDGPPATREIYSNAREQWFFETCLPIINSYQYHEQPWFMIYFKPCQQQYYIYIYYSILAVEIVSKLIVTIQ